MSSSARLVRRSAQARRTGSLAATFLLSWAGLVGGPLTASADPFWTDAQRQARPPILQANFPTATPRQTAAPVADALERWRGSEVAMLGARSAPCQSARCTWEWKLDLGLHEKAFGAASDGAGGSYVVGVAKQRRGRGNDAWIMRADRSGRSLWRRAFTDEGDDVLFDVAATEDGGALAVGYTSSAGAGGRDMWMIRLSSDGRELWRRSFGGQQHDRAQAITRTVEGDFVVVGMTTSFGAGESDIWAVRVTDEAEIVWERAFGGPGADRAADVVALPDGGVALVGDGWAGEKRGQDLWTLRLDRRGRMLWRRSFDRSRFDIGSAIAVGPDGALTVAGAAGAKGGDDVWITRLDESGVPLWDRVLSGDKADRPVALASLANGDVAVAAVTWSRGQGSSDAWIVRLRQDGVTRWERTYGGPAADQPTGLLPTDEDGIMMVGHISSRRDGYENPWMLRLDGEGGF